LWRSRDAAVLDGADQLGGAIPLNRLRIAQPKRFLVADSPGHEQYTRNMATGASNAEVALILVDARNGLTSQTYRHTRIAALLGIRHVLLVVNKMDLVGFAES
jgi:sulfate adenylyltransferase subunit 1 (EFTu-like GTPase family)